MTTPFTGVLVMPKLKHLLINCKLRRTACRRMLFSGTLYDGLAQWNSNDPTQCRKCAAEYEKWLKQFLFQRRDR